MAFRSDTASEQPDISESVLHGVGESNPTFRDVIRILWLVVQDLQFRVVLDILVEG